MLRWRMRFQLENFPTLMMCLSRLHFLKRPMHRCCEPNDPVSWLMVLRGPLIGWCLARISSRWSGLGLQRMRRLLIKKLLGHSLAIGGPLTRGTFSVEQMLDLYPHSFHVPAVAHGEEYSISFPVNLDKRSYQHVAEDGMYMYNHDFDEIVELVLLNL